MFDVAGDALKRGQAKSFVRWAMVRATNGSLNEAFAAFSSRFPRDSGIEHHRKAAVDALGTVGNPLATPDTYAEAFVEQWRHRSIIGRLTGYRPIVFNVRYPVQTSGSTAAWIGQNAPVPANALGLDIGSFGHKKVGCIVVLTKELVELSDPAAEAIVSKDLSDGIVAALDSTFASANAATDISPGGIANGATTLSASGTDVASAAADFRALFKAVGGSMVAPYVLLRRETAIHLAGLGDPFKSIGANGGDIFGVPAIVSDSIPQTTDSPALNRAIAFDAGDLLLGEGGVEIRQSRQASLQFNDAPDSPPTASTTMIGLWQANLLAFEGIKFANWAMARSGRVAVLNTVY